MIFDALTITGILSAALAGGFLLLLAHINGAPPATRRGAPHTGTGE
jgi:hypothetical protein